ncbi:hypothetical protein HMPREF3038_01595 [Akkermansia sp. KLE1797]|nr:hypothetical protein HMPREF3038_01595 [Akkermansia sp. KLE1797]KXU54086.1 hypothetical protein HMPREF3039_01751 [Akkermansia sp. KLE1798]KZA05570.1 hypothetical protein HMPREF1326_00745 [Akkermansia sp. KLE1605]
MFHRRIKIWPGFLTAWDAFLLTKRIPAQKYSGSNSHHESRYHQYDF